jgi:hypothetical protein
VWLPPTPEPKGADVDQGCNNDLVEDMHKTRTLATGRRNQQSSKKDGYLITHLS